MTVPGNNANNGPEQPASASKPKRVRTGCLTCRERHLKCDEGLPNCQNCRKSNRTCKRGLRLNFIDIVCKTPPHLVTCQPQEWDVRFEDESREIASEYQGGYERYGGREQQQKQSMKALAAIPLQRHHQQQQSHSQPQQQQQSQQQQHQHQHPQHMSQYPEPSHNAYDYTSAAPPAPSMSYQPLPPIQGMMPEPYPQAHEEQAQHQQAKYDPPSSSHDPYQGSAQSNNDSPFSAHNIGRSSVSAYSHQEPDIDIAEGKKEFLTTQEETLFMQVFVEEVGLWMDSMDPMKHFSRLLPFHSLQEPMLLNAFLACGARHLTLVNPAYSEEKALHYYDTATRYLLKNLQNPNRDTVICATTAVILNVYEIMSERALQRMNHIAGARALIKECGWNARAQGIGAACFWLNVGLEVLSCLHFNWQVAWDPDDWGIDMDFTREVHNGREEIWTHRMLYIVAKVANFRATIPRSHESNPRDEDMRRQNRFNDWQRLKAWADAWNEAIPRTMHPMAYLYPYQTSSKSCFPEVWLIKRSTIVARLFYHTVMILLAQIHPYLGREVPEMQEMQQRHVQMVCGIVAHVKDRGVASVAIRSLAHAAECLTDRREQEEVLEIFRKINRETGWRIAFVFKELKDKWGWQEETPQQQQQSLQQQPVQAQALTPVDALNQQSSVLQSAAPMTAQQQQAYAPYNPSGLQSVPAPQQAAPAVPAPPAPAAPPARQRMPSGIMNPIYANADFTMPSHPYQNVYVAPNQVPAVHALYY